MRALAILPAAFEARLRSAICPPDALSVCTSAATFVDAVARGWPDVAVVDPTSGGAHLVRTSPRQARLGTVAFVQLTPAYAKALIALSRAISLEVVAYGYNDDPRSMRTAIRSARASERGRALTRAIAPEIERLPVSVRDGLTAVADRGSRIDSVAELAIYCSVSRWSLSRACTAAGLRSAERLVIALRLAQGYDVLSDRSFPLSQSARRLGASSARVLHRQCIAASQMSIAELREGVVFEDFVHRLAGGLRIIPTARRAAVRP